VGVDGRIKTPAALPSNLGTDDHSLGFLNAGFNNLQAWLSVGWMIGYLGDPTGSHISSYNQYRLYFEQQYPNNGIFYVRDVSALALTGQVNYRIEYKGGGCWETFYNDTVSADFSCHYPISGSMSATNETGNGGTGTYSSMPESWFGSSTPNTNATMRLKGATGWADWASTVKTSSVQYRPYFYYSIAARCTYFKTFGATQ
jgi:hypothetical protein